MVSSRRGPSKENLYYFFGGYADNAGQVQRRSYDSAGPGPLPCPSYSLFLAIREHPRRNSSQGVMSGKDE